MRVDTAHIRRIADWIEDERRRARDVIADMLADDETTPSYGTADFVIGQLHRAGFEIVPGGPNRRELPR